jgi:uroporphyrinogen decarboxylase
LRTYCRHPPDQRELKGKIPLIGFAGAPFTLASYAIEGGHSNNFAKTKAIMYGHPESWHRLCALFAEVIGEYLVAQVEAGVDVVQVFDSWVGALNAADYREFILPHTAASSRSSRRSHPYPRFTSASEPGRFLAEMRQAGGDVIGADWRTPLDEAWERIGHDRAVQGNLDPTLLLGPIDRLLAGVDDVLARAGGRPGSHLQPWPRNPPAHPARTRPGGRPIRAPAHTSMTTAPQPCATSMCRRAAMIEV